MEVIWLLLILIKFGTQSLYRTTSQLRPIHVRNLAFDRQYYITKILKDDASHADLNSFYNSRTASKSRRKTVFLLVETENWLMSRSLQSLVLQSTGSSLRGISLPRLPRQQKQLRIEGGMRGILC